MQKNSLLLHEILLNKEQFNSVLINCKILCIKKYYISDDIIEKKYGPMYFATDKVKIKLTRSNFLWA